MKSLQAMLLFGLALAWPANRVAADAEIEWRDDLRRATAEASESGRPVLVDVWAVWCAPCKEMDETTYRDPAVVERLAGFVPLKIDADVQEIFIDRYRVEAFPTILFLDGKGREVTRFSGLIPAARMIQVLEFVGEGYGAYVDGVNRDDTDGALAVAAYLQRVGNPRGAADRLRRALKSMKKAAPEQRERVELRLAEAQQAADELKAASGLFERLAERAAEPEVRARALAGLVRNERSRGNDSEAERLTDRLRTEFPQLADGLVGQTP